jgi:hypothetical protein
LPEKRKISRLELQLAYQSLKSLQSTIVSEEQEPRADDDGKPDFAEVVTKLLEMMRARLDGPQA